MKIMNYLPGNDKIVPVQSVELSSNKNLPIQSVEAEIVEDDYYQDFGLLSWFRSLLPSVSDIKQASLELERQSELTNEQWLDDVLKYQR